MRDRKILGCITCLACACSARADWTHLAADAQRSSRGAGAPVNFSTAMWTAPLNDDEEFILDSSPVFAGELVILPLRQFVENIHEATALAAWDMQDGSRKWTTSLLPDLESSASAAADPERGLVYYGTDTQFYALWLADGSVAWHVDFVEPIVNASALVTHGLEAAGVPANRVLISDFANNGAMYAFNIDPWHATGNPYDVGELVWSRPLGSTSGATPAFAAGVAYVASYEFVVVPPGVTQTRGIVRSFDARSGAPGWTAMIGPNDGFFGGVTVADGFVYAATYDFFGSGNNSRLFKLRASDGGMEWVTPCERTDSIPVVADSGRIFVSCGIDGFGSARKIQCFVDHGSAGALDWEVETVNGMPVGGWKYQPAMANGRLFIGSEGGMSQYQRAFALRVDGRPTDPDFVVDSAAGVGGPPAINEAGVLVSFGAGGLRAFAPLLAGDLNCDGSLSVGDIAGFVLALTDANAYAATYPDCEIMAADVNQNGVISVGDIASFVSLLTGGGG